MTDIDWSKAPKGFPIWIESLNEDYVSDWHREEEHLYRDRTGKVWMKEAVEYSEIIVHKPHRSAVWTGSGLPPVGTVCEVTTNDGHNWHPWKILFSDDYVVLVGAAEGKANYSLLKRCDADVAFRPIRTEEQVAADEREKAIEALAVELAGHLSSEAVSLQRETAAYLHDIGYRRVEQ